MKKVITFTRKPWNAQAFNATESDVHQDVLITNMAIGYTDPENIAEMIFPVVNVNKISNNYPVWRRDEANRIERSLRAPGVAANIVSRNMSSDTYMCKNYALRDRITREMRANADPGYISFINGSVDFLTRNLNLGWEQRVSNLVNSTSNVGSSAAVSSSWSDITSGNSDPLGDIWTAIYNVEDSSTARPNKITFGLNAWRQFRRHESVRGVILGRDGAGNPTTQQVANYFEVEEVQVGRAQHNVALEGQDESIDKLWPDNVLVHHSPASPSLFTPSFGYTFRWVADGISNMQGERHPYDSKTKSEDIEVGFYQDEKVTAAEYGFLITDCTSD